MKYLRRGSGYYIDVGACDLVADGRIKLAHGQVDQLTEDSVVLADGTELPADLVVYATGYGSMNGWAADLIGQEVADKVGKVWGLGSDTTKDPGPWEGEQRNMWKPTQQPNLWFHGGNLHQSRHYSLYLALQLKARHEGIADAGVRPAGGAPPELIGGPQQWVRGRRPVSVARGHHRRRRAGLGAQAQRADSCRVRRRRGSSRCAPRRSRCSTPMRASRTCAVAASTCTTSGAMPRIRAGCGDAPRWPATAPTTPDWDVIIDVDELAREDDENWVWAGAEVIEPDYTLALIELSRGGADATVIREFDMQKREFVIDGFQLPEAKSAVSWEDHDTVLVGTDFGPGSLTESGYPRILKRWRRGQPLEDARDALLRRPVRRQRRAGATTVRLASNGS